MKNISNKLNSSVFKNASIDYDVKKGEVVFDYPIENNSAFLNWLKLYFKLVALWGGIIFFVLIIAFIFLSKTNPNFFKLSETFYVLYFILLLTNIPPLFVFNFLYLFRKRFLDLNPEFEWLKSVLKDGYYEKTFTNLKSKEIIIPAFDNIGLDYKAYGDYGKYLKKVKIIDEPVTIVKRKKRKKDYYWSVKFAFEKIPKKGKLWVRWA